MIKKVIRCVGFLLVIILTLSFIYSVLSLKDTNGAVQDIYSVHNQLGNTPKDTIDVLFMGTSHCYNSVYPAVLWQNYGIASFDFAITSQPKFCTYYYLREILKKQSPKVVCIEAYNLAAEGVEEEDEGTIYRNYLGYKSLVDSYNLMKDYGEDNKGDFLFKWPIVHTRYKELTRNDFSESNVDRYGCGAEFRMGETGGYFSAKSHSSEVIPISDENKEWVDRMYALAEEEGFELLLFLSPFAVFGEEREIMNGVAEYSASLGIPFLNLIDEADNMGYDPAIDMMNDFHHCNMNGAAKVSDFLGTYLSKNYDIPNHAGESSYYHWDMDLEMYLQTLEKNALYEIEDIGEYLSKVADNPYMTVVLSLDGNFEDSVDYLEYFGVSYEEAMFGGKWIYKEGAATRLMENIPGESMIVDLGRFDSLKLSCNDNPSEYIKFNLTPVTATENGLNVIIYDTLYETLVDVKGL